jgi:SAM-dependent methyltransferase
VVLAEARLGDYVLGTTDAEIARLGVQHGVWRERMRAAWDRAGIASGWRVIDVGAGPGYATLDLAERVGPSGQVIAIERSARFAAFGAAQCQRRGFSHVRYVEADVTEPLPLSEGDADAAWCRWVAIFLTSPERLVDNLARALRPGGVAIFHEYVNYATWRMAPRRPLQEEFVQHVMASWRDTGSDPDVGLRLPTLLEARGFRIRHLEPIAWLVRPDDPAWRWLASYMETGPQRLRELGRVDADWIGRLHAELRDAEVTPGLRMMTPMVLEIIADRTG